jgi:hypothetical protein
MTTTVFGSWRRVFWTTDILYNSDARVEGWEQQAIIITAGDVAHRGRIPGKKDTYMI